ncbi:uncharacterized protein BXZ73DRAFT_101995 [Epithele typhae]|uniref:uncharacterized protein n=1 Tax=Epithele typhae TaxID=378194 RepID=UPI0020075E57|nr:uncharacterized protein BXZ73DRAFT_101995 [Epithele typhae]KAH9929933.1 hypothetical protein BXZ73DRAFT_101995 [Epithele typhae]
MFIPPPQKIQTDVLADIIEWAKKEKRIFLKRSLETRLVDSVLDAKQRKPALALIETLLTELKRLDVNLLGTRGTGIFTEGRE